jgi:hypothetical protein
MTIIPHPNDTGFTQEQIFFLEKLIDQRIQTALGKKQEPIQHPLPIAAPKQYHTLIEIRTLITDYLQEIVEYFGQGEFDIAILRHFLARKTAMKRGDLEMVSDRQKGVTRWDSQVLAAINQDWPTTPIITTKKRRIYRLSESVLRSFGRP